MSEKQTFARFLKWKEGFKVADDSNNGPKQGGGERENNVKIKSKLRNKQHLTSYDRTKRQGVLKDSCAIEFSWIIWMEFNETANHALFCRIRCKHPKSNISHC